MRRHAQEIDLHGPNGVQLGMYSVGDRSLELEFANPRAPRTKGGGPSSIGPQDHWYHFKREL